MQNILIDEPYQYVPPHRGNWWPTIIQRFKLIDIYLRKHGITSWEIEHGDRLRASLDAGHGIMLTPNHCRPEDPIVMGWLARAVKTHVFGMASWHLFKQDWFTGYALRKMGGFSVYREGIDRQAINEAIKILETAERPLIIFPEGAVTRTNDRLGALLDGVTFIARTAAKRRKKNIPDGKVVVHPVAIKYLFQNDLEKSLDPVLTDIEHRLTWRPQKHLHLIARITKVGLALLSLKEAEYLGKPRLDQFQDRLQRMIDRLLVPLEEEWLDGPQDRGVVPRIKALRMKIMPEMVRDEIDQHERDRRWKQLEDLYLTQQVASYPSDYISTRPSVDRLLETVERFHEDLTDKSLVCGEIKAVIRVGEPIVVSPTRDRKQEVDPLMTRLERDMQSMLDDLALSSPLFGDPVDAETSQIRVLQTH